jgi:DNA-directed RNA polymerase specialized sigma24 family protein
LSYLLDELGDPAQRQIALGKLHGKTNQELARELDISLRAVERKLAIIRDKWRGEYGDE